MSGTASAVLSGRRILVVEDEYMIAQEVAKALSNVGADVVGPVARVSDALRVIGSKDHLDGALLDVNVFNEAVWPVVDVLLLREVPVLLATGYDASAIPAAYTRLPRCEKPASGRHLMQALASALVSQTSI